jgi:hypothetical protein
MNRCRRTIFFIDTKVQGALMVRTAIYWMFWLLSVSLMLICWNAYTGPSKKFIDLVADLFHRYGPGLIASLVVLPIVMMDVVRLSNRFVGPVMRLRGALQELAAGRPVKPLHFRDDDFWRELAGDLNEVAARLNRGGTQSVDATQPIAEFLTAMDCSDSIASSDGVAVPTDAAGVSA